MMSFSVNCAKSFIGKPVNLHLKNGDVLPNITITKINQEAECKTNYKSRRAKAHIKTPQGTLIIRLCDVAYAQNLTEAWLCKV